MDLILLFGRGINKGVFPIEPTNPQFRSFPSSDNVLIWCQVSIEKKAQSVEEMKALESLVPQNFFRRNIGFEMYLELLL